MSNKAEPSVFEEEIEEYIADQETNKRNAIQRNPTLNKETVSLNWAYDLYLDRAKYILNGIREHEYGFNNHQVIEHVIQNDYQLNSGYVKLMRTIIEDSIKMRVKIEELEERLEKIEEIEQRMEKVEQRQLEQRLANLRKNGGSRKSFRNRKTIKNKSRK